MLIAVVGPTCAGKRTVIDFLVEQHGFARIGVASSAAQDGLVAAGASKPVARKGESVTTFSNASDMLDWATIHWERPLVIANPFDTFAASDQEALRKRPFFLLISITAPVLTRWRRAEARGQSAEQQRQPLVDFLEADDLLLYGANAAASSSSSSAPSAAMRREESTGVIANLASLDINGSDAVRSQASGSSAALADAASASLTARSARPPTLHDLVSTADLRILNTFPTLALFLQELHLLSLPSTHRLRPSWDTYFLSLCTLASLRSNCMKRRVGAVLVRNNRVLSTGYNGTPRGLQNCNQGGCARCNGRLASARPNGTSSSSADAGLNGHAHAHEHLASGAGQEAAGPQLIKSGVSLDECLCLHAEENALLECGRERGGAEGTVLYCNTCPCLRCAVKIVQTGVREVVYQLEYSMDDRSREIFAEAGVVFRKYIAPI